MTFERNSFQFQATAGSLVPGAAILAIGVQRFGWAWGSLAASLLIVSLLLHEAGHITVAWATNTPISAAGICLKGPYIRRKVASSWRDEACIISAGLTVNVLIVLACWNTTPLFHWLAGMNMYFAVSNLIPLGGSDSQRMLKLLRQRFGVSRSKVPQIAFSGTGTTSHFPH